MGIPLDPPEYGNDCLACFPAGKTPKYVYATFTNIIGGDEYVPGISPIPPNGTYKMEQANGCSWEYEDANVICEYRASIVGISGIELEQKVAACIAFGAEDDPCTYAFEQDDNPVGLIYCAGEVQVAFVENPGNPYALRTIADLISLPLDSCVLAEFWPLTRYTWVPMFASHRWPTKIHLKIDWTHWDQYDMFES